MSRGKYAKRATLNRDFGTAEQRAVTAERERDRLARELADTKGHLGNQVVALKSALDAARSDRDKAASPGLTAAEDRIRELSDQVHRLKEEDKYRQHTHDTLLTGVHNLLLGLGLTETEAEEVMLNFAVDDNDGPIRRIVDSGAGVNRKGALKTRDGGLAIQRARGHRHSNDGTAVILEKARTGLAEARSGAG